VRQLVNEYPIKTSTALNTSTSSSNNLQKDVHNSVFEYKTVDVLGVPIALIEQNEIISVIQKGIQEKRKGWITGINGHALNLAYKSLWLKDFYNHALLNCSEGFGVVIAAFLSGVKIPKRKVWAEWAYELLQMLEKNDYSLFLLGGTDKVGEKAIDHLHALYPKLRIFGRLNGYSDINQDDTVFESISRKKPDIIFVALGMPKQEEWIYRNIGKVDATIFFPVGALLDYISGMKKRCPHWMSRMGVEWVYRLCTEPHKVWRRYLIGNPLLIWRSLVYFARRVQPKA
jgi:N-acetylglucosaminyldiphosphoundecaprenol N-acetyl-beta-D-mannosaminyltransferase